MHYCDTEQLKDNILQVVFYKHCVSKNDDDTYSDKNYDVSLESIQQCRYINPYILKKFLVVYEYILADELNEIDPERWYQFTIRYTGWEVDCFKVEKIEDVSESSSEFHRLH